MAERASGKRDFDELERRRMKAVKLLQRGLSQAEVARRLNVARESVRRWWNRFAAHGSVEGLKKASRPGRKPRLTDAQLKQLRTILRAGPAKSGPRGRVLDAEANCESDCGTFRCGLSCAPCFVGFAQQAGMESPTFSGFGEASEKNHGRPREKPTGEAQGHQKTPEVPKTLAPSFGMCSFNFSSSKVDCASVARSRRLSHALQCMRRFLSSMTLAAVSPSPDMRRFNSAFCKWRSAAWLEYKTFSIRTPVWKTVPWGRQ